MQLKKALKTGQFLFITACICSFLSCSFQYTHPKDYKGEVISFGRGGGFTGKVSAYHLVDKGYLYQTDIMMDSFVLQKKLKPKQVKQLLRNYKHFEFDTLNINAPGNNYYYISYYKKGVEHKIQWGERTQVIPSNLRSYFDLLFRLTQQED